MTVLSDAGVIAAAAAAENAYRATGGARGWPCWCGVTEAAALAELARYASLLPVTTEAVFREASRLGLHREPVWRHAPRAVRVAFAVFHGAAERLRLLERAAPLAEAARFAARTPRPAPLPEVRHLLALHDAEDELGGRPASRRKA